jgi:hypothetical protein
MEVKNSGDVNIFSIVLMERLSQNQSKLNASNIPITPRLPMMRNAFEINF